jgi:hypothetical protein
MYRSNVAVEDFRAFLFGKSLDSHAQERLADGWREIYQPLFS